MKIFAPLSIFLKKNIMVWTLLCVFSFGVAYKLWWVPFHSAYRKYCVWTERKNKLEAKLEQLHAVVTHKKYFIRKIMTDAQFRARVAKHQTLSLNDNEYIIFFKQKEDFAP